MTLTVEQIASIISGQVEGRNDIVISNLAKIESAGEGELAFLANPKYTHYLYSTKASAIIVSNKLELQEPVSSTLIRVADPYASFAKMLSVFQNKVEKTGISSMAFTGSDVKLGEDVYLGPFACIGDNVTIGNRVKIYPNAYVGDNCVIGDDTIIYAGVNVYNDVKIGARCILHSGCVIGADGFGFARQQDGHYEKVPQTGTVVLCDDVEIGANTTIDRATMGATVINKGVKLDNQVVIAHNVEVGADTVMAAQCGVSGSTKVGNGCTFGGQVGIAGHIQIADNVTVGAQSGVAQSIKEEGQAFFGTPVMPLRECQRTYIHIRHLDDLVKQLNDVEKRLKNLEQSEK